LTPLESYAIIKNVSGTSHHSPEKWDSMVGGLKSQINTPQDVVDKKTGT
jgi:hypothetical protein